MNQEAFRFRLRVEKAKLFSGRRDSNLEVLTLTAGAAAEDHAPLVHDQFVAVRTHKIHGEKLKLIDAALRRLDEGTFGKCEDCGRPIALKRLEAIPWASRCVPCQERTVDSAAAEEVEEHFKMIA
ncbi:MAG: TraR/DksA family transcriptional regulator [Bryobacteraceae bacterium]|nr:TraR/DksA family transcriptional regulator [Bryobacterales bacterium]NUN01747.1 TraR/DksA family transcriptional regulator [Bryobacteraceae bacterium]